tara:strand:- start:220 stop:927 length:708 start_codon:yes stop_codon:yes gene_type:complete
MPLLSFSIGNIIKFFTFLSPIFISSFLVLQSFVNFDLKGLAYLIGTFVAYGIGMLVKLFFHYNFKNNPEDGGIPGSGYFTRKPVKNAWGFNPGAGANPLGDSCSVFAGPFSTSSVSTTSMPSLNAIYHAFTISYIAAGIATNPNKASQGSILFLALLLIFGLTNMFFRVHSYCDSFLDIIMGILLGIGCGVAWYYSMKSVNESIVYHGREKKGKCVLGEQKFSCSYDDTGEEVET